MVPYEHVNISLTTNTLPELKKTLVKMRKSKKFMIISMGQYMKNS
jgi:hypothetical protein